ncbi:uncharacterized protein LOC133378954 [Rhineura floridana]|uniref:uncharacterized protein LOC133378954 n=1 Tax=Rhineura floridana TaxID=261503 RepID=UPI002AC88637|nr:uncharacterized protein LOC133378954 [Rhineura floridana]
MGLVQWCLQLLGATALLLLMGCHGTSAHSLSISYLLVSEPDQSLPQFVGMLYVDNQLIGQYDSEVKRALPKVPWMGKAEKDDPYFWDWSTQRAVSEEWRFRDDLQALQKHNNHSKGFHTWQRGNGCELSKDGRKGGYYQNACDGKDFISLDMETLTWTAADVRAEVIKRRWEAIESLIQRRKDFLEKECIEWLQRIVEYGKEILMRREAPTVQVTRKKGFSDLETLACHVRGFYPKEIDAAWRKDGEIVEQETFRRDVAPNSDGTYYAWLSIKIDPKDRDCYRCHVEHDGLSEPLDVAWEEPGSHQALPEAIRGSPELSAAAILTQKWDITEADFGNSFSISSATDPPTRVPGIAQKLCAAQWFCLQAELPCSEELSNLPLEKESKLVLSPAPPELLAPSNRCRNLQAVFLLVEYFHLGRSRLLLRIHSFYRSKGLCASWMRGSRRNGASPGALLFLAAATPLLLGFPGSFSHSLHYFCTGVSESSQELPQFTAVGYVDDQLFVQYDSNTEAYRPRVSWVEKVEEEDPQHWRKGTQTFMKADMEFRKYLPALRNCYKQSKGFHTLQLMYGCELSPNGRKGGYWQYGYDGKDHVHFNKETQTWVPAKTEAQRNESMRDPILALSPNRKAYLEKDCIEWLQKYLEYGKEALLRTDPPTGKVTHQAGQDDQESLICQAYGFYPKEIDTFWRKDEKDMVHTTFRRDVAPNSDGTYHAWLSIDIDPQDRDHYRCHVEHDGLREPLVLAWKAAGRAHRWGIMAAVVLSVLVWIIIFIILRTNCPLKLEFALGGNPQLLTMHENLRGGIPYEAASASDQESNNSVRVDIPDITEVERRNRLVMGTATMGWDLKVDQEKV